MNKRLREKKQSYVISYNKLLPDGLEYKIMETITMPEENMGECLGNLREIFPTHNTKANAIKKIVLGH